MSRLEPEPIAGLRRLRSDRGEEACAVGRCRERPALTYLGWRMCWRHWLEHCAAEQRREFQEGMTG